MRVATVDGLVTLFYDGSRPLWNIELHQEWLLADWEDLDISDECNNYWRERQTWEQVIVVNGVTEIPESTFSNCENIGRVIFADTVIRIEKKAFVACWNLVFIKWSINLEFIEESSFRYCNLSSVFFPPSCRRIGLWSFSGNTNLTIFTVPQNVELAEAIVDDTVLLERSPFENVDHEGLNDWIKNINNRENFTLHRVCCSYEPTLESIVDTMKDKGGPKAFKVENSIDITPSQYLKENPYTDIKEKDIINEYVLQMMGES